MSKYTDFFPLAGGGSGGDGGVSFVTNPDDIPLSFIGGSSATYTSYTWYDKTTTGFQSQLPIFDPDYAPYRGIASQTVNGTEYTLLNISNGSGYLCNVATAHSAVSTTQMSQEIVIIVDGVTYTYTYNPASSSSYRGAPRRLLWGFAATGNSESNTEMLGVGGRPNEMNSSLPPLYISNGAQSLTRIFSVPEFRMYNLPKLRFESSLVVKVTTSNIYTSGGFYDSYGGATYYLDTSAI